jgi:hypothetical protein
MFSFRAEGFSCSLDVLYGDLGMRHCLQHCFYDWYLFIAAGDAGVFRAGTLHLHAKSRGEQLLDKTKSTL